MHVRLRYVVVPLLATLWPGAAALPGLHAQEGARTAADAIRAAVATRIASAGAEISIEALDLAQDAPVFREARPDPAAALGQPIRFALLTRDGAVLTATATVSVIADHVVVRQPIARGAIVAADDVAALRAPLRGLPLKPLPALADVVGARSLRRIDPGAVMLSTFVVLPRAVEPGDPVVVSAGAGVVEVTASMIAVDGGRVGDVIRIRYPESRTFLRGRIVRRGYLEVIHGR
jgi:flagella basal body P-ring formation protein FlgA